MFIQYAGQLKLSARRAMGHAARPALRRVACAAAEILEGRVLFAAVPIPGLYNTGVSDAGPSLAGGGPCAIGSFDDGFTILPGQAPYVVNHIAGVWAPNNS